jgi:putative redox protein
MTIHPNGTVLKFRQNGTGTGVLHAVSVEGTSHVINAEGHPTLGGKDTAPSPLDLVLAGLASCNQVTSFIVAKGLGIEFSHFDIELEASLDNSVLAFGVEGNANFSSVDIKINVATTADPDTFDRFSRDVERRCPVTQLFVRSGVTVNVTWSRFETGSEAKVA